VAAARVPSIVTVPAPVKCPVHPQGEGEVGTDALDGSRPPGARCTPGCSVTLALWLAARSSTFRRSSSPSPMTIALAFMAASVLDHPAMLSLLSEAP